MKPLSYMYYTNIEFITLIKIPDMTKYCKGCITEVGYQLYFNFIYGMVIYCYPSVLG